MGIWTLRVLVKTRRGSWIWHRIPRSESPTACRFSIFYLNLSVSLCFWWVVRGIAKSPMTANSFCIKSLSWACWKTCQRSPNHLCQLVGFLNRQLLPTTWPMWGVLAVRSWSEECQKVTWTICLLNLSCLEICSGWVTLRPSKNTKRT